MLFNAKNQITLWGPDGNINGNLHRKIRFFLIFMIDYASKHWGGLVNSYYLHRWETFIDMAKTGTFNEAEFKRKLLEVNSFLPCFI